MGAKPGQTPAYVTANQIIDQNLMLCCLPHSSEKLNRIQVAEMV